MTVYLYNKKVFLVLFLSLVSIYSGLKAQQIVDSCFISVETVGKYTGSDDLQNLCMCSNRYASSDLLEWNPDEMKWDGALVNNPTLDLPPPTSDACQVRGIWMGSKQWTENGEAFGLRLSGPLESGKTYSYNFTYIAEGANDWWGFEPMIYTCKEANLSIATPVARLPYSSGYQWLKKKFTFTASAEQNGHTWLIIHSIEGSGIILSNCKNKNPFINPFLPVDTVLCSGDRFTLHLPERKNVEYRWDDQSIASSLEISDEGTYSVEGSFHHCIGGDTITVNPIDCYTRLTMPNIFTPNGDNANPMFVPKEYNYIEYGTTVILNRWGSEIFSGDLFTGWNGKADNDNASNGVYYYRIFYTDPKGKAHEAKGIVTLAR